MCRGDYLSCKSRLKIKGCVGELRSVFFFFDFDLGFEFIGNFKPINIYYYTLFVYQ